MTKTETIYRKLRIEALRAEDRDHTVLSVSDYEIGKCRRRVMLKVIKELNNLEIDHKLELLPDDLYLEEKSVLECLYRSL